MVVMMMMMMLRMTMVIHDGEPMVVVVDKNRYNDTCKDEDWFEMVWMKFVWHEFFHFHLVQWWSW